MTAKNTYRWPDERRPDVENALRQARTRAGAAKILGVSINSLDHACATFGFKPTDLLGSGEAVPVISVPSSPDLPIDELVAQRKRQFELRRKHEDDRKLIGIQIASSQPIGILHFGDPHVDDDGCDVGLLEEHARLVRETPGLYGATVGDLTNNWVGRLAKLYAQQGTTAAEGWRLAEWFIRSVGKRWLYIVAGNHDCWSGAGDPLAWITGQVSALYQASEVRVALRFPGKVEIRVNCRHDFAGHSQWNAAHGVAKALQFGARDHLGVCGHKHVSGYNVLVSPETGITQHALQIASYKRYDRYARERGFRDQTISPCALTVIRPTMPATHPDLVKVFWDPAEGADYLGWLRSRKAA